MPDLPAETAVTLYPDSVDLNRAPFYSVDTQGAAEEIGALEQEFSGAGESDAGLTTAQGDLFVGGQSQDALLSPNFNTLRSTNS